jgi:hypothetical protein
MNDEIWTSDWQFEFKKSKQKFIVPDILVTKMPSEQLSHDKFYIFRALRNVSVSTQKELLRDKVTGDLVAEVIFTKKIGETNKNQGI